MHEVVVGVDGSDESRTALRWGVAVAASTEVPVRAVQAWTYSRLSVIPGWPEPLPRNEMEQRTLGDLGGFVEDTFGAEHPDVRLDVRSGPAAGAIMSAVGPESVLVLGSRGLGGFTGMLLGSVSRACVEYAPCPVIIARSPEPPVGTVLVGIDGSDEAAEALRWATSIAKMTGAHVAALYLWQTQSSEVSPRLHARLKAEADAKVTGWAAELAVEVVSIEGDPRRELIDVGVKRGATLIVVGRRGTSRLTGIATGGVTSYLVGNCPMSVAVHPPAGVLA
jgi:nucleotide-binding universal stress UspA family protein